MLKIEFRARRKDNGEWVEGSWLHKTRKGEVWGIVENESNEFFESYRESLQVKNNSTTSTKQNWVGDIQI